MTDFVDKGFWTVLPLDDAIRLPGLRLSPLGVVPQRERRPRLIVDYTFSRVNQSTVGLAPAEAMQFGRAFQRILHQVRHADPAHGPVYIAKVDIADGFYRVKGHPDLFAAGDIIRPHLLTTAIGQASIAAEGLDAFLAGRPMVDLGLPTFGHSPEAGAAGG